MTIFIGSTILISLPIFAVTITVGLQDRPAAAPPGTLSSPITKLFITLVLPALCQLSLPSSFLTLVQVHSSALLLTCAIHFIKLVL